MSTAPISQCTVDVNVRGWIDITEEKPVHEQLVIVAAGDVVTAAKVDASFYGDGRIWFDGCGFVGYEWEFDFENHEVTHWMPLPEAPNKI